MYLSRREKANIYHLVLHKFCIFVVYPSVPLPSLYGQFRDRPIVFRVFGKWPNGNSIIVEILGGIS